MHKILHYLGNFAGIIIAFVLYGVLQEFYFYPRIIARRFHIPYQGFVTALVTVLVMAFIFWIYKKQLQEVNYWHFNQEPHWNLRRILIAILGFFLITFLGAAMLSIVSSKGQTISTNQKGLDLISKQSGDLFKIMVCFVAPFCEEVIFRGMFFNTFFTKNTTFNKWAGILTSGFVFAYLHDPMLSKFILVYWVLGCVLAWVYMMTKDLRYSMITHMCYNSIGFISMMMLI